MTLIETLVDTAQTLAAIQIQGVFDETGFSNADKFVGAHLARLVAMDPQNTDNVVALAGLISKYRRQSTAMIGEAVFLEIKDLAQGTKITKEQRDQARHTILSVPGVHPKYGASVAFSWQGFSEGYAYAVRQNGAHAEKDQDGQWRWIVPAATAAKAAAELIDMGAMIVGSYEVPEGMIVENPVDERNHIEVTINPDDKTELQIKWTLGRHREWLEVIKSMPKRRFDWGSKSWYMPLAHLMIAHDAFLKAGADVSDFEILAPQAPALAQIQQDEPEYIKRINSLHWGKLFGYQKVGIEFLLRPLDAIRKETGPEARGQILADDMGLGKTLQLIFSANAFMGPDERALIVCPASLKNNWVKEIKKWLSGDEKINVIEALTCPDCGHGGSKHAAGACVQTVDKDGNTIAKFRTEKVIVDGVERKKEIPNDWHYCMCACSVAGGFDPDARWNIINYDILPIHYFEIEKHGFSVLICDEAHYAKNRDSSRSKLIVGGLQPMPKAPTDRDQATKSVRRVKGLASMATGRVWMATGTPVTNRPRDLFNLLKAVGHPLGSNFLSFGMKYCDPQTNAFGTVYNGATNMADLRERVDPIFIQRKKEDELDLPPKIRDWMPVEVDLKRYWAIMSEYAERRKSGELSSIAHHLAALTEARVCAAIAKVPATIEIAETALEGGHKILIFSNNTKCVDQFMEHFGEKAVKIDGKTTKPNRTISEERFMTDDSVRVIVGNLLAMGTGLNLTAGTYVLVNDLDWVPANHLQAEDRAYRIGQALMVNVIYVLAADTFDEEMAVMLESKFAAVNDFERIIGAEMFQDFIDKIKTAPRNNEVRAIKHGGQVKKVAA